MIRAILFDKDGTLTDFRATWEPWIGPMLHDLAAASGGPIDRIAADIGYDLATGSLAAHSPLVTSPGDVTMNLLVRNTGWTLARLRGWLGARPGEARQVTVPGVVETLADLQGAGFTLGVLTNATQAGAQAFLQDLNATRYFDRVIGCDSGFGAKPDPRGAADFADTLGLGRDEVLMVGDGLPDMQAASAAGLRRVGVLTGTLAADDLAALAHAVLPDVTHLPRWLRSARL